MTTHVVTDEQLGVLGRRQNDLFRRVREGTLPIEQVLRCLQDTIEGNFDAVPIGPRRLIDCDASPFLPDKWTIESHRKCGLLEFDPAKVVLHIEDEQKVGSMKGDKLRVALQGKPTLNACVLDHLLADTAQIPESWKVDEQGRTRYIYFWDTVYRDDGGSLCVRCLCFESGRWRWGCSWLGRYFGGQNPAAILAS